jgi:hypothetical protein
VQPTARTGDRKREDARRRLDPSIRQRKIYEETEGESGARPARLERKVKK